MGFPEEKVKNCLKAAYNNRPRAVEYLLNVSLSIFPFLIFLGNPSLAGATPTITLGSSKHPAKRAGIPDSRPITGWISDARPEWRRRISNARWFRDPIITTSYIELARLARAKWSRKSFEANGLNPYVPAASSRSSNRPSAFDSDNAPTQKHSTRTFPADHPKSSSICLTNR